MKNLIYFSIVVFLFAGCNKTEIYSVINSSSQTIEMQDIKDANKSQISNLAPGKTDQLSFKHKATNNYNIEFGYTPANLVKCDIDSKGHKITFTNR